MTPARCVACLSPVAREWHRYCRSCRAWADLAAAFRFGAAGLDERRLRAARAYFARMRARPLDSRLDQFARRIEELETAMAFVADRGRLADLEACR